MWYCWRTNVLFVLKCYKTIYCYFSKVHEQDLTNFNFCLIFNSDSHSIHVFLYSIGVLDKPGSEFTGIFWLYCNQVPEDPAGSETSQSSVQIWGHAGEIKKKYISELHWCPFTTVSAVDLSEMTQQLLVGLPWHLLVIPWLFHHHMVTIFICSILWFPHQPQI